MIGPLVALVVTLGIALVSRPLAPMVRLVDAPDGDLKSHTRATPVTGGIAVVSGVVVGWLVAGAVEPAVLVMMVLLFAIGTLDDIRPLPPVSRLVAVAAVSIAFAVWSADVEGIAAALITMVLVLVIVNAVNLLDGADGVAGTAALIAFVGLAALASLRNLEPTSSLVVAGALVGFLVINWPPARVFLGDGGAYAVGGLLVSSALASTPTSGIDFWGWIPGLVVATSMTGIFIVDLLLTVFRRLRTRTRLTGGDRLHIYDRLNDRGWSPSAVAFAIGLAQLLIVSTVALLDRWLGPWGAAAASASVLVLAAVIAGSALSIEGAAEADSV